MENKTRADSYFHFKQFSVRQNMAAMKVGVDSIVLGAWAPLDGCDHILDVGCGTGILSLQLAQRFSAAKITGVEIDVPTGEEAFFNVTQSPWSDRINVVTEDVRKFARSTGNRFDGIICNPPYFSSGILPGYKQRKVARHQVSLNLQELLRCAALVLDPWGLMCLILPAGVFQDFERLAGEFGFFIQRTLRIHPKAGKPANRICSLWGMIETEVNDQQIVIRDSEGYDEAFKALTSPFYR